MNTSQPIIPAAFGARLRSRVWIVPLLVALLPSVLPGCGRFSCFQSKPATVATVCDGPRHEEVLWALVEIESYADRITDRQERDPADVQKAVTTVCEDCSFGGPSRRTRMDHLLPGDVDTLCQGSAAIQGSTHQLVQASCAAVVTDCFTDQANDMNDLSSIRFEIDAKDTPQNLAQTIDPQKWDKLLGTRFVSTRRLRTGSCPTTQEAPSSPEADENLGEAWSDAIYEHFEIACPTSPTTAIFQSSLMVNTSFRSSPQAYCMEFDLCSGGSYAGRVCGAPDPTPAARPGLLEDAGFVFAEDSTTNQQDPRTTITAVKRLQYTAEACGQGGCGKWTASGLNAALKVLANETAIAISHEIKGKSGKCGTFDCKPASNDGPDYFETQCPQ